MIFFSTIFTTIFSTIPLSGGGETCVQLICCPTSTMVRTQHTQRGQMGQEPSNFNGILMVLPLFPLAGMPANGKSGRTMDKTQAESY